MIVKTNTLDYTFVAILLIIMKEKKIYPIVFHFYTFKAIELNYNIYDKKLPVVFKVFYT